MNKTVIYIVSALLSAVVLCVFETPPRTHDHFFTELVLLVIIWATAIIFEQGKSDHNQAIDEEKISDQNIRKSLAMSTRQGKRIGLDKTDKSGCLIWIVLMVAGVLISFFLNR